MFFLLFTPFPAWANGGGGGDCIPEPIPDDFNLATALVCILGNAISGLLGFVVPIALILLIFGGFRYMASAGDQRAMESSKKFLTWVIIGTALALGAVLVFKVINTIIETG